MGKNMDNDHSSNQDKMLTIGVPLKAQLLNLSQQQKRKPRVEIRPKTRIKVAAFLQQKKEETVCRKRKRNETRFLWYGHQCC